MRRQHFPAVWKLLPTALPQRMDLNNFLWIGHMQIPVSLVIFLLLIKLRFTRQGVYNKRNFHLRDNENLHTFRGAQFQHQLKINVLEFLGVIQQAPLNYLQISMVIRILEFF